MATDTSTEFEGVDPLGDIRIEDARARALVEVAHGAGRPARPWWEVVLAAATGAAGLGLFVVVLGAIAMWVRFKAAGLPAGPGLEALSPSSLAAVGASDFAFPLLLNGVAILAANSHIDAYARSVVQAVRAGEVPPEPRSLTLPPRARAFGDKLWAHRAIRVLAYIALAPVYFLNIQTAETSVAA